MKKIFDTMPTKKYTNMIFLNNLTRGNSKMMSELVRVYLEETPKFINKMKVGIENMDLDMVARASHSLTPSFATVGINAEFSDMIKRINEYAEKKENPEMIKELFLTIEDVCLKARRELEEELMLLEEN